jgi:hypothetical protein
MAKAAAAPEAPVEVTETQQDPDAVVIVKIVDEHGNIKTGIQTLGNVQITEVATLLELGLRGFRAELGLSQ